MSLFIEVSTLIFSSLLVFEVTAFTRTARRLWTNHAFISVRSSEVAEIDFILGVSVQYNSFCYTYHWCNHSRFEEAGNTKVRVLYGIQIFHRSHLRKRSIQFRGVLR